MGGDRRMARVIRLSAIFLRRRSAIGVRQGGLESTAVAATIVSPTIASLPPTSRAFVRRVPGRNLWIWYRATAHELVCVTITRSPPVPIDE
jgi:hypothetical protein